MTQSVHVPAGESGNAGIAGLPVFSAEQVKILEVRGLSTEAATAAGIVPVQDDAQLREVWPGAPEYWTVENGYLPGLLFQWRSPLSNVDPVPQLRPDNPPIGADGDPKKYVFPPGAPSILHTAHLATISQPDTAELLAVDVLIVEGSCQSRAAGIYAPPDVDVFGIAGCQSWLKAGLPSRDLAVVEGRRVLIALDADAESNRAVYDAGMSLREAVMAEGATEVFFLRVPGGRKTGLDDVLGDRPEASRQAYLTRLIEQAISRPKSEKPGQPAQRRPDRKSEATELHPDAIFDADGKLRVATLSRLVIAGQPAALTREQKIALYTDGVYRIDGLAFVSGVARLLGEDYRPAHRAACEEYTAGVLSEARAYLPDRLDRPLLNVANGMLNLITGELLPHDPSYLSVTQFPVRWDPDARCPTYDAWAAQMIGDQLDDLEESASMMLDPSLTPTKALFLFGPTRSGKSTFLRLMVAVAGQANVSGVTLHKLVTDKFAAANVFGMALNVAADLSAQHLDDLSTFKVMTGEDVITADRKYGRQFTFTNRALFAFSANKPPTIGETSNAYIERIKPFRFGHSFAGHEDPAIEQRMMTELPGILVRWVAAYQRRRARGAMLPTDPGVRAAFEMASDRVRQWLATCCDVVPVEGSTGDHVSTVTHLYQQFRQWCDDEGSPAMARSKFASRLALMPGVYDCRDVKRVRGLNIRVRPRDEWGQLDDAVMAATVTGTPVYRETGKVDTQHESADKSLTSDSLAGSPGNSGLLEPSGKRENRAHTPSPRATERQVVDYASKNDSPEGSYRQKLPSLPNPHNGQNGHVEASVLTSLITETATGGPPRCPQCDGPTELVDDTWYACRRCHPATVRAVVNAVADASMQNPA